MSVILFMMAGVCFGAAKGTPTQIPKEISLDLGVTQVETFGNFYTLGTNVGLYMIPAKVLNEFSIGAGFFRSSALENTVKLNLYKNSYLFWGDAKLLWLPFASENKGESRSRFYFGPGFSWIYTGGENQLGGLLEIGNKIHFSGKSIFAKKEVGVGLRDRLFYVDLSTRQTLTHCFQLFVSLLW